MDQKQWTADDIRRILTDPGCCTRLRVDDRAASSRAQTSQLHLRRQAPQPRHRRQSRRRRSHPPPEDPKSQPENGTLLQ